MAEDIARKDRVRHGIASYRYEREVIYRVLRRYGPICADQFDRIFGDEQVMLDPITHDTIIKRKPVKKLRFLMDGKGGTFVLGGVGIGYWPQWLGLIQCMSVLGEVVIYNHEGTIYYKVPQ